VITPRVTFVKRHPTSGGLQVGQKVVVRVGVAAVSVAELNAAIADLEAQISAIEAGTIPESVATDIAALKTAVATLEEEVASGTGGRTSAEVTAAITALQTAVANLTTSLSTEASTRGSADTALGARITEEATARAAADTTLTSNLADEVSARQSADSALTAALSAKADLVSGKVPASQIPGTYDDVLEYAGLVNFPATGEAGKIYVDTITNLTYRWSGSTYAALDSSLALGETSATAYRGDRGAAAYAHSQTSGNPHGLTKADLVLGNVDNTPDASKPVSTAQASAIATAKAEALAASEPAIAKSAGLLSWTGSAWAWLTGLTWSLLTGIPDILVAIITAGAFKTINNETILGPGNITITGTGGDSGTVDYRIADEVFEDFHGGPVVIDSGGTTWAGGIGRGSGTVNPYLGADVDGGILLETGTDASSWVPAALHPLQYAYRNNFALCNWGVKRFIVRSSIVTLLSSTLTGHVYIGLLGNVTLSFYYDNGTPYFQCMSPSGTTTTSVSPVAEQQYIFEVCTSEDGGTAYFYIDNNLVGTHDISSVLSGTASSTSIAPFIRIARTTADDTTSLGLRLDYYYWYIARAAARRWRALA